MAEMGAVSRWFVNTFKGRANARLSDWLRANLVLRPEAECLELGCGNGNMAARIVDRFQPARYVATDLDPQQIRAARRYLETRYPEGPPDSLDLRTADMLHLAFRDESFDAVFAFAAIHHASPRHGDFPGVLPALAEIRRVLRPGGLLVYEEFVHKDRLRAWLRDHGFAVLARGRRWPREMVIARKAGADISRREDALAIRRREAAQQDTEHASAALV